MRGFVALDFLDRAPPEVTIERLGRAPPAALRWAAPSNLHVTLKFALPRSQACSRLVFYKSEPGPEGSRYTPLFPSGG